jgi:hypothetical protein
MEKNQNKLQTSNLIFETAFLASNLLAQFSRQIVIQILGMASPKVCGNLALLLLADLLRRFPLTTTRLRCIVKKNNLKNN